MNYGQAVSHTMVRMIVHDGLELDQPIDAVNIFDLRAESVKDDNVPGWSVIVSSLEQINQITEILDSEQRVSAILVLGRLGRTFEKFRLSDDMITRY